MGSENTDQISFQNTETTEKPNLSRHSSSGVMKNNTSSKDQPMINSQYQELMRSKSLSPPPPLLSQLSNSERPSRNHNKTENKESSSVHPPRVPNSILSKNSSSSSLKNRKTKYGIKPTPSPRKKKDVTKVPTNNGKQISVSVRSVDLASRTAFERINPITPPELIYRLNFFPSSNSHRMQRKLSPSLQHCEILEKIYNQSQVRQLAWCNAESLENPFHKKLENPLFLDRMKYMSSVLPKHHMPLISNKKYRLPMRADVGFPNILEEEIRIKQKELQREAECEEISPRLIVILSSEDLKELEPNLSFDDKSENESFLPYNIFSPPLDSSKSSSQGWRPRPFSDRLPCLRHLCVSLLDLKFDVGDIEPLVCSLSLYYNPGKNGCKISEDFIVPMGEAWNELLHENAANEIALRLGMDSIKTLSNHKKKALFSYDPIKSAIEDIYIVLQVYKASQSDGIMAYLDHKASIPTSPVSNASTTSVSKKKLLRKPKIFRRNKYMNSAATRQQIVSIEKDVVALQAKAKISFEASGTQLLTPLCFGIVPVAPLGTNSDAISWPNGICQSLQLYCYADDSDSADSFLERLGSLVDETKRLQKAHEKSFFSTNEPIPGRATIFISCLGLDFTQIMLHSPKALSPMVENYSHPRLLVDISGDCAIMMLLKNRNNSDTNAPLRRSNLVRLPPSSKPSGYSDSFEVREVLYFPPENGFVPFVYKSFLNLLYIYPRSLNINTNKKNISSSNDEINVNNIGKFLTLRVRMLQMVETESSWTVLESIYNPVPGPQPLVKTVYAKLHHRITKENDIIAIRDEIKIRLPKVLDGTFFIELSLCSIEFNDLEENLLIVPIAESTIPLSHYDKRLKVRTIIPNGLHHIKIGDLSQLELETKLVSSIHVSDTVVSNSLRQELNNDHDHLFFPAGKDNMSFSLDQAGDSIVTHFHSIMYKYIGNLLRNGAPEYRYLPSSDAIKPDESLLKLIKKSDSPSLAFWLDNIMTIFTLCALVKNSSPLSRHEIRRFWKDYCDGFDELVYFSSTTGNESTQTEESFCAFSDTSTPILDHSKKRSDSLTDTTSEKNVQGLNMQTQRESISEQTIQALEEKLLDTAILVVAEHLYSNDKFSTQGVLIDQELTSITHQEKKPFSRKPYGVSKLDRMLAEAEVFGENASYQRLWEDDDTTIFWNKSNLTMDKNDTEENDENSDKLSDSYEEDPPANDFEAEKIGAIRTKPIQVVMSPFSSSFSARENYRWRHRLPSESNSNTNLAKRVHSVAQVMIAPCMAPSLSTVLAVTPSSSQRKRKDIKQVEKNELFNSLSSCGVNTSDASNVCCPNGKRVEGTRSSNGSNLMNVPAHFACCVKDEKPGNMDNSLSSFVLPGSDLEEDIAQSNKVGKVFVFQSKFHKFGDWIYPENSKLRGDIRIYETTPLKFSLPSSSLEENSDIRPYFYEIYFGLCLTHYIESNHNKGSYTSDFIAHLDFMLPLCLKSIILRCSESYPHLSNSTLPLSVFDGKHMTLLLINVELWAQSLQNLGFTSSVSSNVFTEQIKNEVIDKNMNTTELSNSVINFFIGLLAIIHPAQVSLLMKKYLNTLRESEPQQPAKRSIASSFNDDSNRNVTASAWTSFELVAVNCSHHLRLNFIERLAVLPQFVEMNYSFKYQKYHHNNIIDNATQLAWADQTSINEKIVEKIKQNDDTCPYPDGLYRLPREHWLAELLLDECLSICLTSCESIVAEAMAHLKSTANASNSFSSSGISLSINSRRNMVLSRDALLQFQSSALRSITCVYDLLLRRHSLDIRYSSSEEGRSRIASLFVRPMILKSMQAAKILARMEPTHKVRMLWLLCFLYIFQEAPEYLLRKNLRQIVLNESETHTVLKYIRILKLCSVSFQRLINLKKQQEKNESQFQMDSTADEIDFGNSTWLLQESFNTLCAAAIVLVDECAKIVFATKGKNGVEIRKMAYGIFDLLLHILSVPHSPVTNLRALGAASQALDIFGIEIFLRVLQDNLQHWTRIILTFMNSTSLSVRSMAVDLLISILGSVFEINGNIDEISLVFLTIMPEVVAREIGLYCVSGMVSSMADIECILWPLRRSVADVEEANPLDDDRVDAQLSPLLSLFCRACQAILDGVLIELRLMGGKLTIAGLEISAMGRGRGNEEEMQEDVATWIFDADEESLYEIASFFLPETAPLQRIRWLTTLQKLHESKSQWLEAAETLFLCARTLADSLLHIKSVWRPSRYNLWNDNRKSLWLTTIGHGNLKGNTELMKFANMFLEPINLMQFHTGSNLTPEQKNGKLYQPSVSNLCEMLTTLTKKGIFFYQKESGMESLAFLRLEQLLKKLMGVVDTGYNVTKVRKGLLSGSAQYIEESAALRKLSASINSDMTKLAESMLLLAGEDEQQEISEEISSKRSNSFGNKEKQNISNCYVRVLVLGKKVRRFEESTAIPTFLEWGNPSICRIPQKTIARAKTNYPKELDIDSRLCSAFAEPLLQVLASNSSDSSVVFRMNMPSEATLKAEGARKTFLVVSLVHMSLPGYANSQLLRDASTTEILSVGGSKRFLFYSREPNSTSNFSSTRLLTSSKKNQLSTSSGLIELTVGLKFPCALSRQRTIITSEYLT